MPTSEAAHAAWAREYVTRRVTLKRGDPEPFKTGQWLGKGGWSEVYETGIGGTVVALKRVYFRNTPRERILCLNELDILEKMSGRRHRHVVELIGSYELPLRGNNSQLGLLVWPVAQCDLSRFLGCLDLLGRLFERITADKDQAWTPKPEEEDALDEISRLNLFPWDKKIRKTQIQEGRYSRFVLMDLHRDCVYRLFTMVGCLAQAIAYLHDDQKIRHKDLKPSQVLLSSDGLWLTDFGWSMDVSELSNSATNNGGATSVKYHAPERATRGQRFCGRPEDIFALGCIFLEMTYRMWWMVAEDYLNPGAESGWSYQANLDLKTYWLEPLQIRARASRPPNPEIEHLTALIDQMLDPEPTTRPRIRDIVDTLAVDLGDSNPFFGNCCLPVKESA
ncbi:hypothetical protein N0V83_000156 [Neocucurbitaria cava]|uniref:Protein kinase domain-containing protein n=1 Tax=Neocucurbitaria cava TaxID=798079 RepID=A0A9W9CQW5_9PLEO|nr:hypothetical protein N0V83_000156 [Neocucurbitaria cava]